MRGQLLGQGPRSQQVLFFLPSTTMAYHSESSSPMLDDDSPWLDDPEHSLAAASSAPQTRHDPVSQQEWEKLSLRYSDVRAPPTSAQRYSRANTNLSTGRLPRRHHLGQEQPPPNRLRPRLHDCIPLRSRGRQSPRDRRYPPCDPHDRLGRQARWERRRSAGRAECGGSGGVQSACHGAGEAG